VSLEFFIVIKSFRSHCAPGVDSASNRNEHQAFPGVKGGRCVRLTLPPFCAVLAKSGNLNFLKSSGPVQACNGTALPLPFMSKVPGLLRFVLLVEPTLRWGWVEWYWQGKTEVFGEKPVLVSLCLLQILHGPAWIRTWASAARYRLTNHLSHSTAVLLPQYLVNSYI
jgi:hypothetical protein